MKELTVINKEFLEYNDSRVLVVVACDGRTYISRADTARALGITSNAIIGYAKTNTNPDDQCLMQFAVNNNGGYQTVSNGFIEYAATIALVTKRVYLRTRHKNAKKAKDYLEWLTAQDLLNDKKINDIVEGCTGESASAQKEIVILSVVVFDKCVFKVAINR